MHLIYIIAKPNFFSIGNRGSVSHALGVVEGFLNNKWFVTVLSGKVDDDIDITDLDAFMLAGLLNLIELPSRFNSLVMTIFWRVNLLVKLSRRQFGKNDVVMLRYSLSKPIFTLLLSRICATNGALSVIEVNGCAYHFYSALPRIFRVPLLMAERLVINRFDSIYVISEQIKNDICASGRILRAKVIVVSNGATAMESPVDSSGEECRIVYAGVLQEYYNFELLLAAVNLLKTSRPHSLHFFGDGPELKKTIRIANDHPRIFFHGRYNRTDLPGLLRKNDIFVLPYRPHGHQSPIKLFEYMSLGLPIVASDVSEVKAVLKDGENAYLYDVRSAEDLAAKLDFALDDPRRIQIGGKARADFRSNYTWTSRMQELTEAISVKSPVT